MTERELDLPQIWRFGGDTFSVAPELKGDRPFLLGPRLAPSYIWSPLRSTSQKADVFQHSSGGKRGVGPVTFFSAGKPSEGEVFR